ncbi:hypothetical protein EPUS_02331 [Endocarpon pusillum Z07020]|uniref:SPRY domain-containing protein n=1 Tax=Endocarpon pusillum (strain Z07020 / HMAS-L-300199) TaxID=1263415 RepID=U1HP34_ENDPU|nr:uncharacterized protein EPUS_02331 [Endocarpon pusillum Z07020]ERF70809.1 hypothetical protein EPUS_02331 [Endocarpon pusillum Z07020]
MGFFKSLKGEGPKSIGGKEESQDQQQRSSEKRRLFGHALPNQYDPPAGPPPSHMRSTEYEPPPGPPPGQYSKATDTFAPPSGPPPRQTNATEDNPPPYHDWTVIPDTALLPPPPAIHYECSANNASWDDAARAHDWCRQNPLYSPSKPHPSLYNAVQNGDISLQKPQEFKGDLTQRGKGQWKATTKFSCTDCIFLSTLPLYFAVEDSPLMTGRSKTIYFEVRLLATGGNIARQAAGVAVGFCAKPYPSWRLPGWQRASLGVHGDDGRRFVNDPNGGVDFTRPFKPGETVGIGMKFSIAPNVQGHGKAHAEVFFTRDGKRDEGWQVDEERDRESDSVLGLEGGMDLYAAVGMFGAVDFEVQFAPGGWLYQPESA